MEHPEPEWTAENKEKKNGDTTFQMCGWCKHVGTGTYRSGCCLDGNCKLLGWRGNVKWDTPCIVKRLGVSDLARVIEGHRDKIEESKNTVETTRVLIAKVEKLQKASLDSPTLPSYRVHDYYTVGDQLYIFHENKWNAGTCVAGYRHQDGCVSYVLDDYPDSKGGWGCGCAVPCVLKAWEYNYFCNNREAFDVWLTLSDRLYNGKNLNLKAYAEALE